MNLLATIQIIVKAFKGIKKAVEQGNADAQNNLGDCYYKGHGV